jgi:hypothetical protein
MIPLSFRVARCARRFGYDLPARSAGASVHLPRQAPATNTTSRLDAEDLKVLLGSFVAPAALGGPAAAAGLAASN